MDKLIKIFVLILVGIFLLFFVQTYNKYIPEPKLTGVVVEQDDVEFNLDNWLNGKFQTFSDNYISENIAFKAMWIRNYNHLELSFFDRISAQTYNPIIKSENDWLFEKQYFDHWENDPKFSQAEYEQLERRLVKLKTLVDSLKVKEIQFLFLISPSKAHVYSDYANKYNSKFLNRNYMRNYLTKRLNDLDIPYLDASAMFSFYRKNGYRHHQSLFPQGGTHWSYFGAWTVLDSISRRFKGVMPEVEFAQMDLISLKPAPARDTDKDLAELTNIWGTKIFAPDIVYPIWKPKTMEARPNILLLSSSFGWTLVHHLQKHNSYGEIDLLYYNKRLFEYPENSNATCIEVDCSAETLLNGKSIFIMEINEVVIPELGWGFID